MNYDLNQLQDKANAIRAEVIKTLVNAGSGHSAGPLGSADFWTALYFSGIINYRPQEPLWEDRDRVIVSAGHYAPVIYVTLAEAGFFPKEELSRLRRLNSRLQGHPHIYEPPGIENTSGPLGQGLSQAVGTALAAKIDQKTWRTICFSSDGEQDEGQSWEAYMFASRHHLSNLTVFIDRNNIQIDGHTEQVMPLEPLAAKLAAFNWHVIEVNGHNIEEIIDAYETAKAIFEKPTVVIMHTIPGKGVEFMENDPSWHGKPPSLGEAVESLAQINELRTLGGTIISEHQ